MEVSQEALERIARQVGTELWKVQGALELLEAGNTLPFVARYRKEQHGALDEQQLRQVQVRSYYGIRVYEKLRPESPFKFIRQACKLSCHMHLHHEGVDTTTPPGITAVSPRDRSDEP